MRMLLSLVSLALVGCAHFNEAPKTVQFPYAGELLQTIQEQQVNRLPASVALSAEEEKSNRRVYFSSLYRQYLTLGNHLGKDSEVQFCPQFHHDKVEADAADVPRISLLGPKHIEQDGKAYFPELAFNQNFSLADYHVGIREELEVLCEEGVSDNFYKFDNLVTHYASRSSFHKNPKAMESVLKIPIFANYYLIEMIKTSNLGPSWPEEKSFIGLTRTHWFDRYVAEASKMRGHYVRNRMVKR